METPPRAYSLIGLSAEVGQAFPLPSSATSANSIPTGKGQERKSGEKEKRET
jgi:hypothetical protein